MPLGINSSLLIFSNTWSDWNLRVLAPDGWYSFTEARTRETLRNVALLKHFSGQDLIVVVFKVHVWLEVHWIKLMMKIKGLRGGLIIVRVDMSDILDCGLRLIIDIKNTVELGFNRILAAFPPFVPVFTMGSIVWRVLDEIISELLDS